MLDAQPSCQAPQNIPWFRILSKSLHGPSSSFNTFLKEAKRVYFATGSGIVSHQEEIQKNNTLNPAFSLLCLSFPPKKSQKIKFEPLYRIWIILILRGNELDQWLTLHINHHL